MTDRDSSDSGTPPAGSIVAAFGLALEDLYRVTWPESFADGIRILSGTLNKVVAHTEEDPEADGAFVLSLLPIVDGLEYACRSETNLDPARRRILYQTLNKLAAALRAVGATPDRPVGAEFEPYVHDAVAVEPRAASEPGLVTDVVERGWWLNGKLLRPSRVVVSQPKAGDDGPGSSES